MVEVRGATREDVEAIAVIARRSIPGAYHHLLSPRTIARWLAHAFTSEAVARSWEDHPILVAVDPSAPVAFAGLHDAGSSVVIGSLYTAPTQRRRGAASALLEAIQAEAGVRPIVADVLLGNLEGERFYEHRGFVPGEAMSSDLFGERVVERRWYRERLIA